MKPQFYTSEELEANAALIAAAPDLLELARMGLELANTLLEHLPSDDRVPHDQCTGCVKAARALREKAGEL